MDINISNGRLQSINATGDSVVLAVEATHGSQPTVTVDGVQVTGSVNGQPAHVIAQASSLRAADANLEDYDGAVVPINMPDKARGQATTQIPPGRGKLVLFFDIPDDLRDSALVGSIKTASMPGSDSLEGQFKLSEGNGDLAGAEHFGGGVSIFFTVGTDRHDGTSCLTRDKRYFLNADVTAPAGFIVEFARPDRGQA